MRGKIAKIVSGRGFGFIEVEGEEKNVFFHCSNVIDDKFNELEEEDDVSFDLEDGPKGKVAVKVHKEI